MRPCAAVVTTAPGVALGILTARDALLTLLREVRYEETLLRDYAMNLGYR